MSGGSGRKRVLFDQNTPRPLRRLLGLPITTAYQVGWDALTNGDLLAAAEAKLFDVMVTCDQSIEHQQNMSGRKIGLVVLGTNNMAVLGAHVDDIRAAIETLPPGGYAKLEFPRPGRK